MQIKPPINKITLERSRELRKETTPQEIIFWSRIKNRKLRNLKFRRQYQLGKYIVDFICLDEKLIIELDGWQHGEQENYDRERTKYLEKLGFQVVRIWNGEINTNLDGVFLKLEELL
ncbi:MAG: DUF559 domain-containing protein [Candidatus Moraniibacteriota bacterium]